jgi:hypothetical protein
MVRVVERRHPSVAAEVAAGGARRRVEQPRPLGAGFGWWWWEGQADGELVGFVGKKARWISSFRSSSRRAAQLCSAAVCECDHGCHVGDRALVKAGVLIVFCFLKWVC